MSGLIPLGDAGMACEGDVCEIPGAVGAAAVVGGMAGPGTLDRVALAGEAPLADPERAGV